MNITYMIGNGFDIALGLKTRYSDFIDYYCKLDKSGSRELQVLQQEMSRQDPETKKLWSCAERAFGQLDWSGLFPDDPVSSFKICLADFQDELARYLEREWGRVNVPNDGGELAKRLFSTMVCVDRFMGPEHRRRFCEYVRQHGKIALNLIVFNYTDTLERLWMTLPTQGDAGVRSFEVDLGGKVLVEVNCPTFVHGDFVRKWYVFGVDNPKQIKDPAIRKDCESTGQLIKPMMDADLGMGQAAIASGLIRNSEVIVTYGISLGSSDLTWSDLVYNHVFTGGRQFVICPYYDKPLERSYSADQPMLMLQKQLREMFVPLVEEKQISLDVSRGKIGNVRLLDESWAGVKEPKCDYFGLASLGKMIVA